MYEEKLVTMVYKSNFIFRGKYRQKDRQIDGLIQQINFHIRILIYSIKEYHF